MVMKCFGALLSQQRIACSSAIEALSACAGAGTLQREEISSFCGANTIVLRELLKIALKLR